MNVEVEGSVPARGLCAAEDAWGSGGLTPLVLGSSLDGSESSASRRDRVNPREIPSPLPPPVLTGQEAEWVPRLGPDVV
jgi:hypothetical protein